MNTFDFLRKYAVVKNTAKAYGYACMYAIDGADTLLFESIESVNELGCFSDKVVRLLNNAYKNCHKAMSIVRMQVSTRWEDVLDDLDGYQEKYNDAITILYNTVLQKCATPIAENFDIAKLIAKCSTVMLIGRYIINVEKAVLGNFPKRYQFVASPHQMLMQKVVSQVTSIVLDPSTGFNYKGSLPDDVQDVLCSAMAQYVKSMSDIFTEVLDISDEERKEIGVPSR